MRYALTRYSQHQRDEAYRIYVTDCLRILTENTASTSGQRSYVTIRFKDVCRPHPQNEYKAGAAIQSIRAKFE